MMMPVYPGAPWLPKFEGTEGEEKYREWREQIKGLLSTQDVSPARKVNILLKTLTGEARRHISVLEEDERDTVEKVLKHLDGLYKETVPASRIRVQFYSCTQHPEESVSSYVLRLRELFCRLRRGDPATAPSDSVLREQFLMGLSEGPLSQALRVYARRHPDDDFAALREEALLLDTNHGGVRGPEVACHAINPTSIPKSQSADWKQEMKQELKQELQQEMLDDVKAQMRGFTRELMNEIRPLLSSTATRPRSPPPSERRARPRYVPAQQNEWDENGRPICRLCKQPGHMARACRDPSIPLN